MITKGHAMVDDARTPVSPVVFVFVAAAFVVVVAGLKAAEAIVIPFFLSIFIAIIAGPPLAAMRRHNLPPWFSYSLITLAIILAVLIITLLITHSVGQFVEAMPSYRDKFNELQKDVMKSPLLARLGIGDQLTQLINPSTAVTLVGVFFAQLGSLLTNSLLIILTVSFILLEQSVFPRKIRAIFPNPESSLENFRKFARNINNYMAIKTMTSLGTGLIVGLWMTILGVDFAILWGLLAFFLNFIPNLGSILASIPAILIAFIQLGWGAALGTAAGYLAINVGIGSILEPRLLGKGLGLSTVVVFVSLVFWGWVFGPMGMLLSVPLTMTIKIALQNNPETRWIAILLSADPPPDPFENEALEGS